MLHIFIFLTINNYILSILFYLFEKQYNRIKYLIDIPFERLILCALLTKNYNLLSIFHHFDRSKCGVKKLVYRKNLTL